MMIYRLILRVLNLQGNFKENGENYDVMGNQIRCIIKYVMYKFIARKNECTVREISSELGIIENTAYKYVKLGVKIGYLKKVNNDADLRNNNARFLVVAEPKLKEFLKEYEKIISLFYQKIILESKDLL